MIEIGRFNENTNLACMSLKTNIKSKTIQIPGYIATKHENLENLVLELKKEFDVQEPIIIAKKGGTSIEKATVNGEGYTIAYSIDTEGNGSTKGVGYIVIWYSNNKLRAQLSNDIEKEYNLRNTIGNDIKNELMLVSVIKVEDYDANIAEFDGGENQTIGITSLAKAKVDISIGQEVAYLGTFKGTSLNGCLVEKDRSNGEGTIAPISNKKTYIGCYADVNDDGNVDGIIFADLSKSGKGTWNLTGDTNYDIDGTYSWTAKSNLKEYYVKQANYSGIFGTAEVIAPKGNGINERFFVMALENFKTKDYTSFSWYKTAGAGKMTPIITSSEFGKGNENTGKMIAKWNATGTAEGYVDAPQDNEDIWKHIQNIYNEGKGWFIPSRAEWAAFNGELGINKTAGDSRKYSKLGFDTWSFYFTSSQYNRYNSYVAYYNYCRIDTQNVHNKGVVRLAKIF